MFMTGFYSKDFILESAYGQFYFSGTVVYFIATIGAMFTTLYSVKVLYLTFLTTPNGPRVNYESSYSRTLRMVTFKYDNRLKMISLFMMLLMTISLSTLLYINGIWVYYYFQCLKLYPYLVTTAYGDLSGMYSEIKWLITIYHLVIFFMSVIGITLVFHINKYMALNVIPKLNSREFKLVILLLVKLELILLIICFIINYYHDYLGGNILMSGIENMSIKDLHPK